MAKNGHKSETRRFKNERDAKAGGRSTAGLRSAAKRAALKAAEAEENRKRQEAEKRG